MSPENTSRSRNQMALAFAVSVILMLAAGILFDHYYEFNDDVLMKDILSGAYTGTPSALNVQMLSPISAVLGLLYRIFPAVPWYGLFLCGIQYGCIGFITYRILRMRMFEDARILYVILAEAAVIFLTFGLFMDHLVMVQYTVTVAIMAAAAAFAVITCPYDGRKGWIGAGMGVPVILIILAFLLRSEMLLLMLPYVAAAFIARWYREKKRKAPATIQRYIRILALIAILMVVSAVINRVSYSSDGWKRFMKEFDNRTKLYDYEYVPEYSANEEFYTSIGLSEADVKLLENYDYGLDDRINGEVLGQVAERAHELRGEGLFKRVFDSVKEYIYRMTHFKGGRYSVAVFILYVMLAGLIVFEDKPEDADKKADDKKRILTAMIMEPVILLVMRSVCWMYIIYGRRLPDRITHSLYIIEIIVLCAMIVRRLDRNLKNERVIKTAVAGILLAGGLVMVPFSVIRVNEHIKLQQEVNSVGDAIDKYCKKKTKNFYFVDLYSTIIDGETFNEKIFADRDDSFKNYDLMGGWIVNSPLYRLKLSGHGVGAMADSILNSDNVYVICSDEYDLNWLTDYYSDRGIKTHIEEVGTVTDGYGVYSVKEGSE